MLYSRNRLRKFIELIKTEIQSQRIYIPYNGITARYKDVGRFAGHTVILKYTFELIFSEHMYSIMYY